MGKPSSEPKETPQQRAFAEVAKAQMADYRKRWLPLQRKLAEDVKDAGAVDSFERRQAAGKAATDSAIRFGEAKGKVESVLSDAGGAASSKFKLGVTGLGQDEAQSRGMGMVATDQAIDDSYLEGLGMIAAMGRGERQGALQGMGDVAAMSGRAAAQDAELAAQRRAGNAQLVGQVAGFGLAGGFNGLGGRAPSMASFSASPGSGVTYGPQLNPYAGPSAVGMTV
jgi:hypothetical protein